MLAGSRRGLTRTEMGNYNAFKLHRIPTDNDQADILYHFDGDFYGTKFELNRIVYANMMAARFDALSGMIANLDRPYRYISRVCAQYIKEFHEEEYVSERENCYQIMNYIGLKFGYPQRAGVQMRDTYIPSEADLALWREEGALPNCGPLNWLEPIINSLFDQGCVGRAMLFASGSQQLYDREDPCKIDIADLRELAGPILNRIRFGTATAYTLKLLRTHAKSGFINPRKIVSVFTGVGEGGQGSFFFLYSNHVENNADDETIMRLILAAARVYSTLILEPREVALTEKATLHGSLPSDLVTHYELKFEKAVQISEDYPRHRARSIEGNRIRANEMGIVRFIEPMVAP